uniref:Uncharacterized protein n=1 Tax=Anguilla anguilla TaxID=7936 RepID=A0A0E9U2M3_ANGAN
MRDEQVNNAGRCLMDLARLCSLSCDRVTVHHSSASVQQNFQA